MERLQLAGLDARVVGPADAKVTAVLLHGFGAPGDDLVPLSQYLDAPARYVFPEAPIALGGPYGGGRAWFRLDLDKMERELRSGAPRDRRAEVPDGLHEVRARVAQFITELQAALAIPNAALVLGGFSQGAMIALDAALHRDVAPAGLVLMSGTMLAEAEWQPRFAKLAGVPIELSHGKRDPLLPFAISELLRDRLIAAGAIVDWQPFDGGHEIPPLVLAAAAELLTKLAG